ncbi:MAG: sporulation protein YqfD [Firmicutes bacterium]|nr:sporulation protein YqfD [Bacillota bacterium]
MFIQKLRYFLTGYLLIAMRGRNVEKLINLAIRHRIPLWDIRRGADCAFLKVDIDSFFELRHLARQTGCRLRIMRKAGLPFIYSRIAKRRGLVIGFCFFMIALYALSSFILFVEVEGNENLEADYILELAEEAGIRPGLFKEHLDKEDATNQMLIAEPRLEWVGVHVRGTQLVIEVAEKIKPSVDVDTHTHLVAAKDGLVTDVLVIVGEAKVKPGDTVNRGQLLVEGILRPQPQYAPEEGADPLLTVPARARGEVTARVWYEGYGEAAQTEVTRIRTGRQVTSWTLLVNEETVLRIGRTRVPYAEYDTEAATKKLAERIIQFPVEIVSEIYYEVELHEKNIAAEEALEIAADRARVLAELQLPAGVGVENVTVEEITLDREGFVGIRYVMETLEDIAVEEIVNGGE